MDYDVIVRGGRVLTPDGEIDADVAIGDGEIAAVGASVGGSAAAEIDATGLHVLPGGIDMHVHFDEPGRTEWEGFATGSSALAVGGMTSFVDMPLNSSPPTVDAEGFDLKLAAARANSRLDFAVWGAIVPGGLDDMAAVHERGAIGFKAFMSETGMDDFRPADHMTLWEGMQRAADLGAIVAVHAENNRIIDAGHERAVAAGLTDARTYLASRPPVAETEAIASVVALAADTGCRVHIVYVSTAAGIELLRNAREAGVDISCETVTHYLALTEDDVERLGTIAKCAPVMRDEANLERLWEFVASTPGAIVASDHSPCAPEMKETDDFFQAWGGITGCQATLGVLLDGVGLGRLSLAAASAAVSANVADRLGMTRKGVIEVGRDADLALVDLTATWTMTAEELQYRHRISALVGVPLRGAVRHVLSRGRFIVRESALVGDARGDLIRPDREFSYVS